MTSPSVQISSIDKSYYIPRITNELTAFVGHFERGPIDVPVYITNIDQFKFLFGRGVNEFHQDWYQVYNFLQYASGLWVVRTAGMKRSNADSINTTPVDVNTFTDWESKKDSISTDTIRFIARTPGQWGNLLSVVTFNEEHWNNDDLISDGYTAKNIIGYFEPNYICICVFRNGTLVETFYKLLSEINNINDDSLYIYTTINPAITIDFFASINTFQLINGFSSWPSDARLKESYSLFDDTYNIDIIIGNERSNNVAIEHAETQKNCIAFIGLPTKTLNILVFLMGAGIPDEIAYTPDGKLITLSKDENIVNTINAETLTKLKDYVNALPQSQYVHFTANIKVQLDMFTNKYKLVNVAGDIAGLKAQASLISPWNTSAGLERGVVKNLKNILLTYNDKYKSDLYKLGVNYFEKNVMMTQRTFYTRPSSFNSVNIRSLFNHIEKETKRILNYSVFEENTYQVRQSIATRLKLYLENIKLEKGITDARLRVHPGEENEIIVDIQIKPAYITEYISIRITNTGTSELTDNVG